MSLGKYQVGQPVQIAFLPEGQLDSPFMLRVGDRGVVLEVDYFTSEDRLEDGYYYMVRFTGYKHPHKVPENWLKEAAQ